MYEIDVIVSAQGSLGGHGVGVDELALGVGTVLCAGLLTDRSALAVFIDNELAEIPGILTVSAAVMLAEPRRYWLDRDLTSGLGNFHAPTLL